MRNKTILLVEDETIIALSQSQTIESYGYRVITAMSGEEALEIVTGSQSIDLVLMDIDLGAGMDGTETAERIMKLRMLPIVFLTSHTEKEMVDRIKGITRYGYVVKNSGEFVLMESINMAFELYEAHRKTLREEEKFQTYIEKAPYGIFVVNHNGQYIDVNHEACRLTGFTRDELLEMTIFDLAPAEKHEFAVKSFNCARQSEEYNDIVALKRKDGSIILISLDVVPLDNDCYMAFCADVTERLEYENELQESRATLQAILDASPIGIGLVKNRKRVWANKVMYEMLKFDQLEYLEQDDMVLYPDTEEYRRVGDELYAQVQQTGRGQVFARLADKNEQELDAMIMAQSLDPDDHQKGQIVTVTDMTGQLKNERLIRKSEYEKSLILNAMYEHVVYYTPGMKIVWANSAACKAVGKKPGEVEGMHCYQAWHGRMEPCENCPVQMDEEKCRQKNYTATSPSGREWEVNVYPVCEEGEITAYIELSREVTEKRLIEKKLQESERRFRELADMLPEIVFETDIHGRIIYGNRAAFEVMGYTREDFGNELKAVDMVIPEDRERVTQNIARLIHGEEVGPVEYRALRKNGQIFPAIISSSLIVEDGTIQGLRGIAIDISHIRDTMNNLENNRNMLQAILQNMPGGTIIIDDEYTIFQVNDRTCQVTGYELTELIGEKCDIICPKGSESKMCPIWEEGQPDFASMETTVKQKDGSRVPVLKNARRLVLDGREYVLENFQDITEIKKARKEIENLLLEKEILLREVHHRIKNDMNVIGSLLSLQAKSADNPEVSKNLDEIFNRIRIMGSIYNTLYRGEQVSRLNIRPFLCDVADSIIQAYTLSTSVTIKKDIVEVWIPARLSFPLGIMVNELLTNAFKYAFKDRSAGMIDISVTLDENQNLRVSVRDDGRGIPDQMLQPAGFGFGLTIFDAMVRQCRGEYTISNTDGTRVDIIIPYTNE